ncbi:hypothetical protein SLE2022_189250 [Rubroshorea leprosula]
MGQSKASIFIYDLKETELTTKSGNFLIRSRKPNLGEDASMEFHYSAADFQTGRSRNRGLETPTKNAGSGHWKEIEMESRVAVLFIGPGPFLMG